MAIQGQLEFGPPAFGMEGSMAQSMFAMKGEDGLYYAKAHYDFGAAGPFSYYMGQIDSNNAFFYQTEQVAQLAQLHGLGLSGIVAGTGFMGQQGGITAIGQPYFWIPTWGFGLASGPARGSNVWLRYKVNAASAIVFDGYTGGTCNSTSANGGTIGQIGHWVIGPGEVANIISGANSFPGGAGILSGKLWVAGITGTENFFGANSFRVAVMWIPFTGNAWDETDGSWEQYFTVLPDPISRTYLAAGTARDYSNRISLMEEPGGSGLIRLFMYLDNTQGIGLGFGGATLLTLLVDPVNHTTDVAWTNVSALFGIPFPDTLYNFAGVLTTNPRNDYTSPTIIGQNLLMMRGYDDQKNYALYRHFLVDQAALAHVLRGDVVQSIYTTILPSGLNTQTEFIGGYGENGILYTMGRYKTQYVYGNMGAFPSIKQRRWFAEPGPIRSIL